MQHSTQGIVLTTTRYKDNAYIVNIFTRDFGKVSYMVHHPQSKKAKVRTQHLGAMTLLDLEVLHRENKEIQQLSEAKLHPLSYALYEDPAKISICLFMADVVQKSLETSNADTDLFQFLVHCVESLVGSKQVGLFALSFLLDYAKFIGIYPYDEQENEWINYLPNDKKALFLTMLRNLQALNSSEKRTGMQLLIQYYQHFFSGMENLKSLDVLTEVFSA